MPSALTFGERGEPRSFGLRCTKESVIGVEIWETCKGLGAGFRGALLNGGGMARVEADFG